MSKKFECIEVAVRLRPINAMEQKIDPEAAWDIKARLGRSLRSSMDFLANGQGRQIQLKNKHRFGMMRGKDTSSSPEKIVGRSKSIPIH